MGAAGFVFAFVALAAVSLEIVNQYERGVKFTFGRLSGVMEPGMNFVIPVVQSWRRVDVRTNALDVPRQDTMTKDNVSVEINAVIYYKVVDPARAIVNIQNYSYATLQLAQTTLRNVVGELTLDALLTSREQVSERIQQLLAKDAANWGVKIDNVEVKDIQLPADLIRVIGKEAEAERERRSVIIRAQGELEASRNLAEAAKQLSSTPGGLHIRMLQTINNLGNEKSITKVITTPTEVLSAILAWAKK
jgi:regulator of protease activity HflC (stomatin/prohibitin superfamily)